MKTSEVGLNFIMDQEGVVLQPYQDQTGHWTIGCGHLIKDGEDFGDSITHAQAMQLLAIDVQTAEDAVNGLEWVLAQNQFDVLVDFAFNAGEGALAKLLSHGLDEVPNQLPRWTHAGGQVLQALVNRRGAEGEMWNS